MSGRRQHFIPKMLLKRFADGKNRVRVTRKRGIAYVASIDKVALESNFLGRPGDGTADDAITREEGRIAVLLEEACRVVGELRSNDAATLLAHLTVRPRGIRNFMARAGNETFDQLETRFSDAGWLRKRMREQIEADPTLISEALDGELRKQFGDAALERAKQAPEYVKVLADLVTIAKGQASRADPAAALKVISPHLAVLRSKIEEVVERSHIRTAEQHPTPRFRAASLVLLTYASIVFNDDLVLGDAIAWGMGPDSRVTPLYGLEDDIDFVAMPLSRSRALVGWRNEPRDFTAEEVNLASAQSSDEFVVSHPEKADLEKLRPEFGKGSAALLLLATRDLI